MAEQSHTGKSWKTDFNTEMGNQPSKADRPEHTKDVINEWYILMCSLKKMQRTSTGRKEFKFKKTRGVQARISCQYTTYWGEQEGSVLTQRTKDINFLEYLMHITLELVCFIQIMKHRSRNFLRTENKAKLYFRRCRCAKCIRCTFKCVG